MEWLDTFFSLPEGTSLLELLLFLVKRIVALTGIVVIVWGSVLALYHCFSQSHNKGERLNKIDAIRLDFGRTIILGLEFIVAADVIATTTAPDYYSVGILASLVGIRTFLTFFMNRELHSLSKRAK